MTRPCIDRGLTKENELLSCLILPDALFTMLCKTSVVSHVKQAESPQTIDCVLADSHGSLGSHRNLTQQADGVSRHPHIMFSRIHALMTIIVYQCSALKLNACMRRSTLFSSGAEGLLCGSATGYLLAVCLHACLVRTEISVFPSVPSKRASRL